MSGNTNLPIGTPRISGLPALVSGRSTSEAPSNAPVDSRDAEIARLREELAARNQELGKLQQQVRASADPASQAAPTMQRIVDVIAEQEAGANPQVAQALAAGGPLTTESRNLLGRIVDQSMATLGSAKGSVMLHDRASDSLSVVMLRGDVPEDVRSAIDSGQMTCRSFKPGEGVAGRAFQSGQPAMELDVRKSAQFSQSYVDNICCVPLNVGGQRVGVLNLTNRANGGSFSAEEIDRLQASLADREQQLSELRTQSEKLAGARDALHNIGKACAVTDEPKALLGSILEQAIKLVGASKGSLMLYDRDKNELKVAVFRADKTVDGTPDEVRKSVESGQRKTVTLRPGEGIAGRAFATRKPVIDMLARNSGDFKDAQKSFTDNILCVPLVNPDGWCLGVINMTNRVAGGPFTQDDAEQMESVCGTAAIAISNAQRLERLSVDSVTHVASRSATEAFLDQQLTVHGDRPVSVLVMDLDHFKEVNDEAKGSQGERHLAGDGALKDVAQRLKGVVGDGGMLGRWGGDEFVAILPDTDKLGAQAMAQRLRQAVTDEPVMVQGLPFKLDLSVGVAVADGWSQGITARTLFNEADSRMYETKEAHHRKPDDAPDDRQLELWNFAS